jgi:hypothetical protein
MNQYDRTMQVRERRAQQNYEQALAFQEAMFGWKSRYLILVVTFGYNEEWSQSATLDDLRNDRDRLWNNMRSNKMLSAIEGYVWKIEEGEDEGGLHMHVVFFFDGQCHADVYYARCLGEYWVNVVTSGRGRYWNSNADKKRLENSQWGDATGQVDRTDVDKRKSLSGFLGGYMAKNEQHVESRESSRIRMFGTSRLPNVQR